jgi:putative transposase
MSVIDEAFLRHPFYGSRKMTAYLNRKNISVNPKRIYLLVRLMGLEPIAPIPNTRMVLQKRQSSFAN